MKLEELIKEVNEKRKHFDVSKYKVFKKFKKENLEVISGVQEDRCPMYLSWITSLCETINPKQVVELGAHAGFSTCMFLAGMPKDSKLITVDINKESWSLVPKDSRMTKVVGDDLDLGIYPKKIDLSKTDLWFIDSDHTGSQLAEEVKLYSPFWNKNTIIILDDVTETGQFSSYVKVWRDLPYEKIELPELHKSGFGIMKLK